MASSARRALAVAFATGCVLGAAGCGGTDRNERDGDFAEFSRSDVQKRFSEVTGVRLRSSSYSDGLVQSLRVAPSSTEPGPTRRFGGVTIYVTGNKARRDSLAQRDSGSTVVVSNVVVVNNGFDDESGAAFRRVVAVVRSLGRPASTARLEPPDTLCSKQGIDPDSGRGKEGSCVAPDQQSVRVVNSDSPLKLRGVTLTAPRVSTGTTVSSREYGFTRRARARDAYVAVGVAAKNTGSEPLDRLNLILVIDGRSYSANSRASTLLSSIDAFPIQPGAQRRATEVFDIPAPAARAAGAQGAVQVELAPSADSYAAGATPTIGRIRLAGAPEQDRPSRTTRLSGSL